MTESEHNAANSITPFAVTNYRDIRKVFGIKQKNRRAHMYVVGKTGTGKSTLISQMAISDIRDGKGLALIDPHGDLAESILHFVPKERIHDVIYFNPGDLEYPIAFNPLEKVPLDRYHLVVSGLISVFKKIWPEFWGPRLEHIFRHSLLTLMDFPGSTLLDLPRRGNSPGKDAAKGTARRSLALTGTLRASPFNDRPGFLEEGSQK
ncbi:helicase HerA domain-containing protein [Syntrophobacter fumaroxidans]|uniref:Helicase HerA central domain-containing protein n=1 Tax=Syntrophobacter fumaroxidans (strain DSM 10017 / MPOB) TaxID=335543 RepID=A0LJW2_SYNFM|nr:DUF87 domain-containing protein [Syntrophobacter fumaroxidans]ABK17714.1 hypothetical protein Sfum_2031 [Syntrophobacter fumaroxidans MPOB]